MTSKAVQTTLNFPFYSTKGAMMTKYSSIDPDSGARVWPSLGLLNHHFEGSNSWYEDAKKRTRLLRSDV
jgi:hypothetical protein